MSNVDIYNNYMDGLRSRIIEDRHIGNYPLIVFNAIWVARDVSVHDASKYDITCLAINILSSMKELNAFKGLHGDMVEGIWRILERQEDEQKKIRLIKKQSIAQKALECVIL